jgi:hypothetical protein
VIQTRDIVRRQVEAMASDVFELGLLRLSNARGERGPEMIPRSWDGDMLMRSLSWLRFENMSGRNIYIRPRGEHHLSLVDDLSLNSVRRMRAEGFQPAAIVETSPENFQVWLNHGARLPKELGTAVARTLAQRFEADTNAADWRHFGRLAGFTNQKEKHRQSDGFFPYVRLMESSGVVYSQADRFVEDVRERLERERLAKQARSFLSFTASGASASKTIETFRQNPVYGGDGTRIDMAYALYALSHGVSEAEVKAAIRTRDLRHKGSERRQDDYVERTIRKALALQQTPSRSR